AEQPDLARSCLQQVPSRQARAAGAAREPDQRITRGAAGERGDRAEEGRDARRVGAPSRAAAWQARGEVGAATTFVRRQSHGPAHTCAPIGGGVYGGFG